MLLPAFFAVRQQRRLSSADAVTAIRRSAVSIPSNMAEGSARKGEKEFIQFLYISLGSMAELETQLIIANNLKYVKLNDYELMTGRLEEIRKMIIGLIKFVKNKIRSDE